MKIRREKREQHLADVQRKRQEQEEAEQQKFYDEVSSYPFPSFSPISHHFSFFHYSYRKSVNKKKPRWLEKKERSIWKTLK